MMNASLFGLLVSVLAVLHVTVLLVLYILFFNLKLMDKMFIFFSTVVLNHEGVCVLFSKASSNPNCNSAHTVLQ